ELAQLEWENLDLQVIENNDRCDAFLYWRSKHIEKQIRKSKLEDKKAGNKKGMIDVPIFTGKKNKEGDK
ncbi:hypothetical protein LCGC14_2892790, partial [marine sediment metagenome]